MEQRGKCKQSKTNWKRSTARFEEVVVATRSLPQAEWRRAYAFGVLVSALCNLRLLDIVVRHLRYALDVNIGDYFEGLLDGFRADTDPHSVGRALTSVLDRHLSGIEAGGALRRALPVTGGHLWDVDGAVAVTALAQHARFYDEVTRHSLSYLQAQVSEADGARIAELIRVQALLTPRLGATEVTTRLAHDWVTTLDQARAGSHRPPPSPGGLVACEPAPASEAATFEELAVTHLRASYESHGYRGRLIRPA